MEVGWIVLLELYQTPLILVHNIDCNKLFLQPIDCILILLLLLFRLLGLLVLVVVIDLNGYFSGMEEWQVNLVCHLTHLDSIGFLRNSENVCKDVSSGLEEFKVPRV